MAKNLKQFRWYSDEDSKNSPENISKIQYENGTAFKDVYPISQLGIQALPGTKFYLNGSVKPLVIGVSGIYDLDIKNGARVTGLSFSKQSLQEIHAHPTSYLIVDILYGEED